MYVCVCVCVVATQQKCHNTGRFFIKTIHLKCSQRINQFPVKFETE